MISRILAMVRAKAPDLTLLQTALLAKVVKRFGTGKDASVRDMAETLHTTERAVTRATTRLRFFDLITSLRRPGDLRVMIIASTAAGRRFIQRLKGK